MNMKKVGILSSCMTLSLLLHAQTGQHPNIIMFLVDDMGWQDTSVPFYNNQRTDLNSRFHTPNMERLAEKGTRFTEAYACAISSPTRCSLMSGMNAARHRVTNWTLLKDKQTDAQSDVIDLPEWHYNGIQPANVVSNLDHSTPITSLPQLLKNNGYYTIHCGKAHFGAAGTPGENPALMGFDENIAGGANGAPGSYLGLKNFGEGSRFAVHGLEKYHGKDIFLTEALTIEAIAAMDRAQKVGKPFYLYMSHYAIHSPLDEDKRFVDKYRNRYDKQLRTQLNENESRYAALVEGMDKSLGDIMNYLERHPEVAQNTILLFMSDNGGQGLNNTRQGQANRDQNYPARGGKGSAFLGGVREPMIVYWPGVTRANTQISQRVMIEDFYPSILEMAGISQYKTCQVIDGISFTGILKSPHKKYQRPIFWHFPNLWGETQNKEEGYGAYSSVLLGDYHLIYTWETQQIRLYNIKDDIGEQYDISRTYPKMVKKLTTLLGKYLRECDAQRPKLKKTDKLLPYPDECGW